MYIERLKCKANGKVRMVRNVNESRHGHKVEHPLYRFRKSAQDTRRQNAAENLRLCGAASVWPPIRGTQAHLDLIAIGGSY